MKVLCLKQLRAKFKTDQDRNDDCDGSCPLFASRDIPAAMPTFRSLSLDDEHLGDYALDERWDDNRAAHPAQTHSLLAKPRSLSR